MTLLSMSLNAQIDATKNVARHTTTAKKADMPLKGIQKPISNTTGNNAPNRAPKMANRGTMTWSWVGADNGTTLPSGWTLTDPDHSSMNANGDGTWYIGVSNDGSATAQSITIPASVFQGCDNVTVVIRAKIDTGYSGKSIAVNGSSKSLSNTLTDYTWENVSTTNGVLIEPTDGYVGFASIIITGEIDSNDETICNGTNTNGYLPIYGLYCDDYQINQMIYPENLLTNLVGKTLTSMTFYATAALDANLSSVGWDVKLGTTTQASFASTLSSITRLVPDDVTTVATGYVITSGINTMTITFTTPFTYNGGNLLVDFQSNAEGQYKSTNFYGVNQSTVTGYNSYRSNTAAPNQNGHYSSGGVRQFLPKVTFTYEKEDQHDLAIALSAPAQAGAGSTVDVTATVTNNGDFAENGYTVTVSDGTNIVNITAQEALGIGETTTFTVQFATSANAGGSTVNYTATVACTDDAVATNNSATASTALINLPPPVNVAATTGANQSATMTWEPPVDPLPVTESFENGVNGWTFIDNDGDGYNWAWHQNGSGTSNMTTNTGVCIVYSESYHNNESGGGTVLYPDNWMISPEIILDGTLSLYASGQDSNGYDKEVFGVYVCVGDYNANELTNYFQQVGNDVTTTHDMLEYTYNLSQFNGQLGHIAIVHHNVYDQFILDIDDISYLAKPQPVSYNIYLDGQLVGYVPSSTNPLSYDFSNLADGEHTCAVSAVYDGDLESVAVPATFTITSLPTPEAPTVTPTTGDASVTISITPDPVTDGNLVYYVEYNGQQTQDLTFPRGASDYVVYVHAHTTATANYNESPEAVVPVTIPALPQTTAPSISYETVGDNVVITATGNGTVTLTIPGYPEASGTGSASITVPRGMQDITVTATATAQEPDKLVSEPTIEQVPIPGLINDGGWMLMEGTYTNGSDQLSFTHLNSDNVVEPILFVDQFNQSTMDNRHPNEYLYKVSEKVSDDIQDARETSEVPVHVHKTYSKLNAIYTEAEVLADEYGSANELRPNVINGTMSYDITAESDIYFYGLYRGNRGEEKPGAVDDLETNTYRISKIQKDLNEDFFNENMLTNAVVPKYNHIEAGDVERIDKEYVDGVMTQEQSANNFLAYVPVIWSYGNHTHRPVGNNSYGSDIKVTHLGNVSATVGGFKSDGSATGEWEYNGTTYCVYTPIIDIYGIMPENNELAPDGDAHAYEPYMYRVWCLYEGARNFKHAPNENGHMSLADDGELHAPFLIGEVRKTDDQAVSDHEVIGAALEHMDDQAQWSFGAPAEEGTEDEMEFIIRFYYKKTVTDAPHYTDGGDNGGAKGLREGDETNRQFYVVETSGTGKDIQTAINEMFMNGEVVSRTYVNAQGMQSDVPFDGLNIVITRYSDGTTSTTKVVR